MSLKPEDLNVAAAEGAEGTDPVFEEALAEAHTYWQSLTKPQQIALLHAIGAHQAEREARSGYLHAVNAAQRMGHVERNPETAIRPRRPGLKEGK